jgi:hypothetical protein
MITPTVTELRRVNANSGLNTPLAATRHTPAAQRDEDPRKAIHLRQVIAVRHALLRGLAH